MLAGVDIGGTKTHVAVDDGSVVTHVVVPTRQWQRTGLHDQDDVARLVELLGVPGPARHDSALAIGAHGCDSPDQVRSLRDNVAGSWGGPLLVVNDAELLGPACGVEQAICLVIGTGSIVVGRAVDGTLVQVGGHGWMLDDFGSAPALTREAVRAVAVAVDTRGPRDGLAQLLMGHFGVTSEVDLVMRFTTAADIATWAQAAPLVFDAAAAGSALAHAVITDAAQRLAEQVQLAHRLGAAGDVVVVSGGVAVNQPLLVDAVATALRQLAVPVTIQVLRDPPVLGALALARQLADAAT